ncbi:MAG: hypothetical protein ABI868_21285 [Acidobacteriota bacterium]
MTAGETPPQTAERREAGRVELNAGAAAAVGLAIVLTAIALTIDVPKSARGFKGDEATYYSLAHSLAHDFDFKYERRDLIRVWEDFPGPEGIFLKRGKTFRIQAQRRFPFVRRVKREDPVRSRLYYAKSFIYPLAAAPFVFLFGTNGFLVFHALLLGLDLFVAYTFLACRGSTRSAALAYATVFLAASVVPVYYVWLTPELFNFSIVLYALFLWSAKERPAGGPATRWAMFLRGSGSDYAAAALVGVVTFSKPTHALLMFPLVALAIGRLQWRRATLMVISWAVVAGALVSANAAITGEFNYQGGDRKTFYSSTGFPFANDRETFENIGPVRGREGVLLGDILVNRHTLTVFRHNLTYFVAGRFSGLLPYLFPGVVSLLLFLATRSRQPWQWLVGATIVGAAVALLLLTPFTYSGGGGPVGNRYFLSFYPLFLFLTPALPGLTSPAVALVVGALFTAQILINPFYASFNPGEHTKVGPLRWLPIELTLLNDLPMAASPDRSRKLLGGEPPVMAYFPDDNAFAPEGEWFWVKGKSRADVILRAPVADLGADRFVSKAITALTIEVQNGARPDRVTISTGRESRTLTMKPEEVARMTLAVEDGVPYRRDEQPTSYVYAISVETTSGFVPFLEAPGSMDSRFLGARVHLVPQYADAETTFWSLPGR